MFCLSLHSPTQLVPFYSTCTDFLSSSWVSEDPPPPPGPRPWLPHSGPSRYMCCCVLTSGVKLVLRCMSLSNICPETGRHLSDQTVTAGTWPCFRSSSRADDANVSKPLKGRTTVLSPGGLSAPRPQPHGPRVRPEAASPLAQEPAFNDLPRFAMQRNRVPKENSER